MKRGFVIGIVLIVICINIVSSLGVTPAYVKLNFKAGFETPITFRIYSPDPNQEMEIYTEGEFANFITLGQKKLFGSGEFTVQLKLPQKIDKPGKHIFYVGVREIPDPELGETIGTSVTIRAPIVVYVPYPGKYIEITEFSTKNVNIGEPVEFNLGLSNRGKEDLAEIAPVIEIYSKGKKIEELSFTPRDIPAGGELNLKKTLQTTNYAAGEYSATAVVNYGNIAKAETKFRIGSLSVSVVNYTNKILIGGIKSFDVEVESEWNHKIDLVHAEISISNKSGEPIIDFKTSPTDIDPWGRKIITGYFDTNNFSKGKYDAKIDLIYYGEGIGKANSKIIEIEFVDKLEEITGVSITTWIIIGTVIFIIILIIIIIILIKRKNGRK